MNTGNQRFQRAANTALVMQAIRDSQPISRAGIATNLGLTRSTITNVVGDLIERQLVVEANPGLERQEDGHRLSGRPPVDLSFADSGPYVVGIDLKPDSARCVVTSLSGTVVCHADTVLTDPGGKPDKRFAALLESSLASVRKKVPDKSKWIGLGVALSAAVDPLSGRVIRSNLFGVSDLLLGQILMNQIQVPILIDNDANCVGWGEIGVPPAGRETLLCALATKDAASRSGTIHIGLGLVVDGVVHYGSGYEAGEFRSASWVSDTSDSEPRGRLGDPNYTSSAITEVLNDIGVIASAIRPKRIHFAGEFIPLKESIAQALAGDLSGHFIDPEISGCPVQPAEHGENAVAVGAAHMFLHRLFTVPAVGVERPAGLPNWLDLQI